MNKQPQSYKTYLRVKTVFKGNYVRMRIVDKLSHYLQFSVFESLVLKNLFNGDNFTCFYDFGFKDDSKASVSNDPLRRIGNILFRPIVNRGIYGSIRGSRVGNHDLAGLYCFCGRRCCRYRCHVRSFALVGSCVWNVFVLLCLFLFLKVTRTRRSGTAFYGGSNVDLDTKQYVSLRLLLFLSLFENNEKQVKGTIRLVNDT